VLMLIVFGLRPVDIEGSLKSKQIITFHYL